MTRTRTIQAILGTAVVTGGGLANIAVAGSAAPAATLTGGFVNGNRAGGNGGGILNGRGATLTTTSLSMTGNTTDGSGGALAAIGSAATTLTSTTITGNSAEITAGGVYRQGGVMTTTASPITAKDPRSNDVGRSRRVGLWPERVVPVSVEVVAGQG